MDLSTTYLGLKLKNPLVPSASPLSEDISTIRQMEDAGAAAVVLYSLFEEQLRMEANTLDYHLTNATETFAEALSFFPSPGDFKLGPDEYLEHVRKAKEAVGIPIIASLNGATVGGWTDYARKIEQAGADALELNVYFLPTDPDLSSADVEQRYVDILKAVKSVVKIPVAMKLSPFFSAMAAMARRLDQAGADGLVLFNRFYQPDFDLEKLEVTPNLLLSGAYEARVPLRWIAVLYGQIKASLAASRGIANAQTVLKMIMAGADVAQVCSVLLRMGVPELSVILREMQAWMREHDYESVEQMKGSMSQKNCDHPAVFERANYMKLLGSYA